MSNEGTLAAYEPSTSTNILPSLTPYFATSSASASKSTLIGFLLPSTSLVANPPRGRRERVQQAGPRSGARRNRPGAHRCSLIAGVTACRHVLPVNRSITRMTELVKLAITCETMLRSAPNCAPAIGRMKRRPMRTSIRGSNCASRVASTSGSTPTAMRPPSSGGTGNILKRPKRH